MGDGAPLAMKVVVAGRKIHITAKAQETYRDQVAVTASQAAARQDLQRLATAHGQLRHSAPVWDYIPPTATRPAGWVLLGEDIALQLGGANGLTAIKCVARGSLTAEMRAARNRLRRQRRQRARTRQGGRRPPIPIDRFDKTSVLLDEAA
jgi:hypothetical protein